MNAIGYQVVQTVENRRFVWKIVARVTDYDEATQIAKEYTKPDFARVVEDFGV